MKNTKVLISVVMLSIILMGCYQLMSDKNNLDASSDIVVKPTVTEGRDSLKKADFGKASEIAQLNLDTDEGKHLQGDLYFLHGRYKEAVGIYEKISDDYGEYQKVLENLAKVYAYHLKDMAKSKEVALKLEKESPIRIFNDAMAVPMQVINKGTFEVPMDTDDPLNPYIPRVKGKINGQDQILTFDTGGNYLAMSAKAAEELGIEYDKSKSFSGKQGEGTADIWIGVADSLQLGDELTLRNVPVMVLSEINTEVVVFGSNIIKEFLTTIDYPNNKFVLTTKDDKALVQSHLDKYDGNKMDFIMWDDHYMMGKGKYNEENVNMFFDSGLVVVDAIDGVPSQAWLTINKENAQSLGIKGELQSMKVTKTDDKLEFAGLVNENALVTLSSQDFKFNDIKCDFLISHGIINKYAWTIDFDNMEYMFK